MEGTRSYLSILSVIMQIYFVKGNTERTIPSECESYSSLTEANRNKAMDGSALECDKNIRTAWYRFHGLAGNAMPTSCPDMSRCGGQVPGWLFGSHPSTPFELAQRTVCFHLNGKCCARNKTIQVRNCGTFYVYHLSRTSGCSFRYCGETGSVGAPEISLITDVTSTSAVIVWDQPRPSGDVSDTTTFKVILFFNRKSFEKKIEFFVPSNRSFAKATGLYAGTQYSVVIEAISFARSRIKSEMRYFTTLLYKAKETSMNRPPQISRLRLERIIASNTDDLVLKCKATGNLPMKFTWLMDGVELVKHVTNEAYSSFMTISPSMGEKTYTCCVTSPTGNHTKEIEVKKNDVEFLLHKNSQVEEITQSASGDYYSIAAGTIGLFLFLLVVLVVAVIIYYKRVLKRTKITLSESFKPETTATLENDITNEICDEWSSASGDSDRGRHRAQYKSLGEDQQDELDLDGYDDVVPGSPQHNCSTRSIALTIGEKQATKAFESEYDVAYQHSVFKHRSSLLDLVNSREMWQSEDEMRGRAFTQSRTEKAKGRSIATKTGKKHASRSTDKLFLIGNSTGKQIPHVSPVKGSSNSTRTIRTSLKELDKKTSSKEILNKNRSTAPVRHHSAVCRTQSDKPVAYAVSSCDFAIERNFSTLNDSLKNEEEANYETADVIASGKIGTKKRPSRTISRSNSNFKGIPRTESKYDIAYAENSCFGSENDTACQRVSGIFNANADTEYDVAYAGRRNSSRNRLLSAVSCASGHRDHQGAASKSLGNRVSPTAIGNFSNLSNKHTKSMSEIAYAISDKSSNKRSFTVSNLTGRPDVLLGDNTYDDVYDSKWNELAENKRHFTLPDIRRATSSTAQKSFTQVKTELQGSVESLYEPVGLYRGEKILGQY